MKHILFITLSFLLVFVIAQQQLNNNNNKNSIKEELLFWSSEGTENLEVKLATPTSFTIKSTSNNNNIKNKILCLHRYTIENVDQSLLKFNDDEIQSLEITYNQHTTSETADNLKIIKEDSALGNRANLYSRYPPLSSETPLLSIAVDYVENSKKTLTEHYSTVKQMSLNDSALLCSSVEPLIGHPLLPLNQSPLSSLVYMGLVPRDLNFPLFNNNAQLTSSNSNKQRFFQQQVDFTLNGWMSALSILKKTGTTNTPASSTADISSIYRTSHINWSYSSTKYLGRTLKINKNQVSAQLDLQFEEIIEISTPSVTVESFDLTKVTIETDTHKHTTQLFTGLTETVANNNDKSKSKFTAVIQAREARKQGFHRELYTNVQLVKSLDTTQKQHCSILLLEHFDQGAFVDRYEVDELKRFGGPSVNLYQLIDLEKPSYTSTQNFVSVSKPFSMDKTNKVDIEITLPFHLRYQNPGTTISRVSTIIPPNLFIRCGDQQQPWERVTITKEVPTLRIETPVGQLGVKPVITLFTLLVTVIGSLVVVIAIILKSKSITTSQLKKK